MHLSHHATSLNFASQFKSVPLLSQPFTNSRFHFFIIAESATSHVLCCNDVLGGGFGENFFTKVQNKEDEITYSMFRNGRPR